MLYLFYDSKSRTRITGKDEELCGIVCDIFTVQKSNFYTNEYLCRKCLAEVKKAHKLQENLKNCLTRFREMFVTNTRVKRGLPSDVCMQENAPAEKATRSEESKAIAPQPSASAKRPNFNML